MRWSSRGRSTSSDAASNSTDDESSHLDASSDDSAGHDHSGECADLRDVAGTAGFTAYSDNTAKRRDSDAADHGASAHASLWSAADLRVCTGRSIADLRAGAGSRFGSRGIDDSDNACAADLFAWRRDSDCGLVPTATQGLSSPSEFVNERFFSA